MPATLGRRAAAMHARLEPRRRPSSAVVARARRRRHHAAAQRLRQQFAAARVVVHLVRRPQDAHRRAAGAGRRARSTPRASSSPPPRSCSTPATRRSAPSPPSAARSSATGRAMSLPYPEPGVRLIRQDEVEEFDRQMADFKAELDDAVARPRPPLRELKAAARERLGSLYNPADYPRALRGPVRRRLGLPQRRAAGLPAAAQPPAVRAGAAAGRRPVRRGGAAGRGGVPGRVRPAGRAT